MRENLPPHKYPLKRVSLGCRQLPRWASLRPGKPWVLLGNGIERGEPEKAATEPRHGCRAVATTSRGPDSGQLRDAEAGLESLRLGIAGQGGAIYPSEVCMRDWRRVG
jgi:hypothetical protein